MVCPQTARGEMTHPAMTLYHAVACWPVPGATMLSLAAGPVLLSRMRIQVRMILK